MDRGASGLRKVALCCSEGSHSWSKTKHRRCGSGLKHVDADARAEVPADERSMFVHVAMFQIAWRLFFAGFVLLDLVPVPSNAHARSPQHAAQRSLFVERAPAFASSAANTGNLPRGAARHLRPGVPGSNVQGPGRLHSSNVQRQLLGMEPLQRLDGHRGRLLGSHNQQHHPAGRLLQPVWDRML